MGELEKLPKDSIAALEIASMSPKTRVDKAREAYKHFIKGMDTADVARMIDVNEQTVVKLVDEELYRTNTHRPDPQHLARARMHELQEMAWMVLDQVQTGKLAYKSQNIPQLLRVVLEAQDKIDKYDGNEKPKRTEHVNLNLADLVREAERIKGGGEIIEAEVVDES